MTRRWVASGRSREVLVGLSPRSRSAAVRRVGAGAFSLWPLPAQDGTRFRILDPSGSTVHEGLMWFDEETGWDLWDLDWGAEAPFLAGPKGVKAAKAINI